MESPVEQGSGVMARRGSRLGWFIGPIPIVVVILMSMPGAGADPVAGSQGIDTSLPPTDSQVTVNGRGLFADLAITVNQTTKLTNQAVSITWTGGTPTSRGAGKFHANYLQIFQCWGDDDGSNAENPGPPPEQCEQGAAGGTPSGLPTTLFSEPTATSRIISRVDWANFDPDVGFHDTRPESGYVWMPFRSVDGTVVDVQTDPLYNPFLGGNYWLNPYFNNITTNEIPGASTGPDGKGAELFQVVTGNESAGLGCGRRVQPVGADKQVPKCWIVVVPRGVQAEENAGTPFANAGTQSAVGTSPLSPTPWQNRIAIPIDFNPVDSPCVFADVERRIAGSELALPAIASWQPALCEGGALPPFSYAPVSDATARQLISAGVTGGPGVAVVSRPLSANSVAADNPVVYSPISVSGLVIGFNLERKAAIGATPETFALEGVRVAELNLTPRLVAKLLTQSYTEQVSIVVAPTYPWLATNPADMSKDPDFLQFNPEFALLRVAQGRTFSGLQLPAGNSDAAQQIWEWVLADPEAKAWLEGQADPFGMVVNPVFNAKAELNPSGVTFYDPIPASFPKADPYCYQGKGQGAGNNIIPPLLCGTDWMPYTRGFANSAQITRAASDGARISLNLLAESSSSVWSRIAPQLIGDRAMLALTDTPSAAQFGLQVARLSRAGDNGPNRQFIAPDATGLAAGVASMLPGAVPTVLEPAPSESAPNAYPLTAVAYAAVTPLKLDAQARSDYAAFLAYATGAGQQPGLEFGKLPRGYVPLTPSLKAQADTAVQQVLTLTAPPPPATTTTTTTTTTTIAASAAATNNQTAQPAAQNPIPRASTNATTPTQTSVAAPETTAPPTTVAPETEVATTTTVPDDDTASTTTTTIVTSSVDVGKTRLALPALGILVLGSGLGVLEITKRPRRNVFIADDDPTDVGAGAE
jgi:hypothetical protein